MKHEILKAKEIMMSTNLTIKAKRRMDDLVDHFHKDKIVKNTGVIKELMADDAATR